MRIPRFGKSSGDPFPAVGERCLGISQVRFSLSNVTYKSLYSRLVERTFVEKGKSRLRS